MDERLAQTVAYLRGGELRKPRVSSGVKDHLIRTDWTEQRIPFIMVKLKYALVPDIVIANSLPDKVAMISEHIHEYPYTELVLVPWLGMNSSDVIVMDDPGRVTNILFEHLR